jgi:glycosyltransferase involved in cell wall biosynthesis
MTPISLAMTVYNRETYLALALDSICNQTYPHWQLTIWDDGSSDTSPAIARAYAEKDDRIQFIPAPHTGRACALKAAVAAGKYPYLGWVDSDDLLAPNALAATVAILDRHPNIGMVYTDYDVIDEWGKLLGRGARCDLPYSPERLLVDFMTFNFRLMRRSIYDRVGGIDLDFPQAQDYDLCLKMSEVAQFYHLQQSHYYYRVHAQSISLGSNHKQTERSGAAVSNALARRGLADRYCLEVSDKGRFKIKQKQQAIELLTL